MSILRIPESIWKQIMGDQMRKHRFASERVGFLATKGTRLAEGDDMFLAFLYQPVEDDHYIDDPTVGARINNHAIRSGMQLALDANASVLHVHQHPHQGKPTPSSTDQREYKKMLPALCNVRPHVPHGALITSFNNAAAFAWDASGCILVAIRDVSIVGTRIEKFPGGRL